MVFVPKLYLKCSTCQNKHPYYQGGCPLKDLVAKQSERKPLDKDYQGPTPSVFVGRYGYPNVGVGPMAMLEEAPALADTPQQWFGMDYSKLIEMRSQLLRGKQSENIKSKSQFITENQLLAMAKKPTDVELNFKRIPRFELKLDMITQPMGPSGTLERMDITQNISISKKIEYVVSDDLKTTEQLSALFQKNVDPYKLMGMFSTGVFGLNENKKLVPTRWSITATDDSLAKEMLTKIRQMPSINQFEVYESEYIDNQFTILLMPGNFEFENFEAWAPGSNWAQSMKEAVIIPEYEGHVGRTTYADGQAGGYYATKFALTEHLLKSKRQARCVIFREVGEGYVIPLGVFVVRETVRDAFQKKPKKFDSFGSSIAYVSSKLRLPLQNYVRKSKILRQRRLTDY